MEIKICYGQAGQSLATIDRINSNPHYALRNLPILRFDRGPIILDFNLQQLFRKRPFRFERMWLTHADCKELAQSAWRIYPQGLRAFKLQQKLTNVKKEFFNWNRNVFGKVDKDLKDKQNKLQELQDSIETMHDIKMEKELKEDIEKLMSKEKNYVGSKGSKYLDYSGGQKYQILSNSG